MTQPGLYFNNSGSVVHDGTNFLDIGTSTLTVNIPFIGTSTNGSAWNTHSMGLVLPQVKSITTDGTGNLAVGESGLIATRATKY